MLCGSYCSVVASTLIQNEVFVSSCTVVGPVKLHNACVALSLEVVHYRCKAVL